MEEEKENIIETLPTKKWIEQILDVLGISEWVNYSKVVQNGLFIFFLVIIGLFYVANTHYAESTVRKINKKEQELKELRWEYMTLKSNLMYERKQSELAGKLNESGIVELNKPPHKIVVEKREY
ncbi:MAG: FtsL-like putative cell division protein [Chitinophagales bacterium]